MHRSRREWLENRRYASSVKTQFRALTDAVAAKDADAAKAAHSALESQIDRAVLHGAFHKNNGARKKSRAARLLAQV